MASIGLKNFRYGQLNEDGETYQAPATLGGAIECKLSLNISEAELYADDTLKESVKEFTKGTMTIGVDEDDDTIFSPLLGESTETYTTSAGNEVTIYKSNSNDIPVYFGFGHVIPKMVDNIRYYKVEWLPKVQFKPYSTDKTTKGESLSFTTPSIEGTVYTDSNNDWRVRGTFESEEEANEFLDSLFVQTL